MNSFLSFLRPRSIFCPNNNRQSISIEAVNAPDIIISVVSRGYNNDLLL